MTQAHHMGWKVTPAASELSFWRCETHEVILMEDGIQYTHTNEGQSQVLLITDPQTEWGTIEPWEGHPLSQVTREQEIGSRVASTY